MNVNAFRKKKSYLPGCIVCKVNEKKYNTTSDINAYQVTNRQPVFMAIRFNKHFHSKKNSLSSIQIVNFKINSSMILTPCILHISFIRHKDDLFIDIAVMQSQNRFMFPFKCYWRSHFQEYPFDQVNFNKLSQVIKSMNKLMLDPKGINENKTRFSSLPRAIISDFIIWSVHLSLSHENVMQQHIYWKWEQLFCDPLEYQIYFVFTKAMNIISGINSANPNRICNFRKNDV